MRVRTVAALYVDPHGPYFDMDGVEPWGERRDASLYPGPHPIVAHPPCGPWGRLAHMCRYQRAELGLLAVSQVRRWGGCLEHPADSKLWRAADLPRPDGPRDPFGGFTVFVRQCDWGHRAAKPTWIYIVGVDRDEVYEYRQPKAPVAKITNNDRLGMRNRLRLSAIEIRTTPREFASWLVALARRSRSARCSPSRASRSTRSP